MRRIRATFPAALLARCRLGGFDTRRRWVWAPPGRAEATLEVEQVRLHLVLVQVEVHLVGAVAVDAVAVAGHVSAALLADFLLGPAAVPSYSATLCNRFMKLVSNNLYI